MANQYRQVIMDAIIDEYGIVGDYLPRLTMAMDRIPDAAIEYCMSTTERPDDDENMIHLLIDECPENIVSMLIEVDEYNDREIQRTSVRNMIAVCLYILYVIAMNVPNHPHRGTNWQEVSQRYAKNGDIHTVISRIVNVHMNRNVDGILRPDGDDIDVSNTEPARAPERSNVEFMILGDEDDETANDNLPEDIEALFRFDNFYGHIMEGVTRSD
jgi:hypothetical protein